MLSLNGTILQSVVNSAKLASLDHPNAQRVRERAQAQGFAYFQGCRWLNAIDRATREHDGNPFIEVLDGHTLLIASPSSGQVYIADGSCQCRAFITGQPCWHRAMSRLYQRYTEAQARQTTHISYQQAIAEMDELFA
jgi:hypothetical protein